MKKILVLFFALTLMHISLWSDLQDHYKKGKITLTTCKEFGKTTDWENYFYKPYNTIAFSTGGHVFVVSSRQHCIFKFDRHGNFIKKFGRKGVGPGDMSSPGDITLIDNKYIVVGEYALNRRINIWDLDGNFIKLVRTNKSNFGTTALRNKKVAYLDIAQNAEKKNGFQQKYRVIIKNTGSSMEKVIRRITLLDISTIDLGPGMCTVSRNFVGEVYMVRTLDGNLAVGVSNQPVITVYSPGGEVIRTFNLKISPIPVDKDFIENSKTEAIAQTTKKLKETTNETRKWWYKQTLKVLPGYDFSKIFTTHLPLYDEILVDADGNFLVFKFDKCLKNCTKNRFQVYSKTGEFICETELDHGIYDIEIRRLCFTKDGIIGFGMLRGDEDEVYRLFKSNY